MARRASGSRGRRAQTRRPRPARRCRPGPTARRSAAALLLLTCAVVQGAPSAAASPAASKERDAQLVYCLHESHRSALVVAAVHLGLLRRGSAANGTVDAVAKGVGPMTLDTWAERRADDFARACGALMTAESDTPDAEAGKKDDGWLTTFLDGLPLLAAGALLTLGGQYSERASSERRLRKQQLESAGRAFRSVARGYLTAYEDASGADHAPVFTARETLHGALAQVTASGPRGAAAKEAADRLPLAQPLDYARDGETLGTDARRSTADGSRGAVDESLREVSALNRWFGHWWWRALRDRARTLRSRGDV